MNKLLIITLIFSTSCTLNVSKNNQLLENEIKSEFKNEKQISEEISPQDVEVSTQNIEKITREESSNIIIPDEFKINADFICQAPLETTENWTLHEESCEEAALLQVYNNEFGIKMTKSEANKEILRMIDWQNKNFNGHFDIYAHQLKELAINFYNLNEKQVIIIENANFEDIKKIISQNHTIVAPATAKYLKNPHYKHQGYHMLQIIGYDKKYIYTNDNGTRKGKNFAYKIDVFMKAMEDAGADILYIKK